MGRGWWVEVVGRGCGCGYKKFSKKIKIKKQKVVKFMKRKSPRNSPIPPRSAKQISESFRKNGH